jgi:photosystem II stability/assembly factor-like uncharacterized protein
MKKCTLLIILCAVFSLTSIAQTSTSWKQVNTTELTTNNIKDIFMLDQNVGFFASSGSSYNTPGLFKTTDGGISWSMFNNMNYIYKIFVFSENLFYFCSGNKIIKYDNGIYTTKQYEGTMFANIYFSSNNIGWSFGNGSSNNGILYKTTDAGNSWTNLNIPLEQFGGGLYATDDNNIWIGGQQKIMYSSNGGTTWVDQTLPIPENGEVYDIQMLDNNTGYAVGFFNGILKTTNGGTNWILKNTPNIPSSGLYKVFFLSETEGYVVGRYGYIAKTTDGGETWIQQNSGTDKNLYSVFFLNSSTGWIGGADGFLAYTDRGGEECTITADFTISGHCPTSDIMLTNVSTGTPLFELGYTWKLDGEAFSNLENPPALSPMEAGTYNISLEIEEGNCISIKSPIIRKIKWNKET